MKAARNSTDGPAPQPGRARCSSSTESPSENQRGTRWAESPRVKAWVSSCQAVEPQLDWPGSRADGASMASTVPKLTPSAPMPASPTVRTEKSALRR